jgi:phenylalanyl-tRNA synthetase alpha chain
MVFLCEGGATMTATEPTIIELRGEALARLDTAHDVAATREWYREYLGDQGTVTALFKRIPTLPQEQRRAFGIAVNALKAELAAALEERQTALSSVALESRIEAEAIDVTLPGRPVQRGFLHPTTRIIREICDIFGKMGFQTVEGPEVEYAKYNFDMLNIPADHPARDVWDTFHVQSGEGEIVLRTHTSPMQVRTMLQQQPPVRVVVPGRCYRYEATDATHLAMFYQVEGLAVDEGITLADLKGTLTEFARQMFGAERKTRFRCDFFPFVEPGVDFAIDCPQCSGKGCRLCKQTGWIELLGAGMVHPRVLEMVGYDSGKYTGFAFGMGPERLMLLKYGLGDIRDFYKNDVRWLRQLDRAWL